MRKNVDTLSEPEQTRFVSAAFLWSKFKRDNVYSGVNVCGKNVFGYFYSRKLIFADRCRKIAKIRTRKNLVPHCKQVLTYNGNRTEWGPIRSNSIIQAMFKIGRPRSGIPIRLIKSMITDRIGRHKVLLPINQSI